MTIMGMGIPFDHRPGGAVVYANGAAALLQAETNGFAFDAVDNSMEVRNTVTPANNYTGTPGAKLVTTRTGTATYHTSASTIATASANTLRREIGNPALPVAAGIAVETLKVNQILDSNFQSALGSVWSGQGASTALTPNFAVGPNGASTAARLVWVGAEDPVSLYIPVPASVSGTVTASCWLKSNGGGTLRLRLYDFTTEFFSVDITPTSTWTRYSVTAAGTNFSGGGFASFQKDTTNLSNADVLISDYQVEISPYASSVIPTVGATVTRAADVISLASTQFNYTTATVSLYAKYCLRHHVGTAQTIYSQNVRAFDLFCNLGRPNLFQTSLGTCIAASTPTLGTANKFMGAGAVNDFAISLNGATVVTDATTSAMLAATSMTFGSRASANFLDGWIIEALHLPRRVSNAELVTRTT